MHWQLYIPKDFHLSSFLPSFIFPAVYSTNVLTFFRRPASFFPICESNVLSQENSRNKGISTNNSKLTNKQFRFPLPLCINQHPTLLFNVIILRTSGNFRHQEIFVLDRFCCCIHTHAIARRPRVIRYHLRLERTLVAAWRQQARQHTAFMGIDRDTKENILKKT